MADSGRNSIKQRFCRILLKTVSVLPALCVCAGIAGADPLVLKGTEKGVYAETSGSVKAESAGPLILKMPFRFSPLCRSSEEIARNAARGIRTAEEYLELMAEEETEAPAPVTGGESVTWIGDSYSVMAEGVIEQMLPGVDLYAAYSKHTQMDAQEGYGGSSGLSILQSLAEEGKLRANLVFALGTNDPIPSVGTYASYLDAVMEIAGEDRTVVFVTPFTMEAAYGNVNYDCEIEAMRQAAAYYPNARVADWADFCQPFLDQFFTWDTIHPVGPDGIECWTDLIVQQLEQAWVSA